MFFRLLHKYFTKISSIIFIPAYIKDCCLISLTAYASGTIFMDKPTFLLEQGSVASDGCY